MRSKRLSLAVRLLLICSLGVAAGELGRHILVLRASSFDGQDANAGSWKTIRGRETPDQIPAYVAWEHFFRAMVLVGYEKPTDVEPSAEGVRALADYNLHIPIGDTEIVVREAKATLDQVGELRRPLDEEANGKPLHWSAAQRASHNKRIDRLLGESRSRVAAKLSDSAMAAIDRYIATRVTPSIVMKVLR